MAAAAQGLRLVIDAGRVVAAFLREGTTRRLVFDGRLRLFAPDFIRLELAEHLPRLSKLAGLTPEGGGIVANALMAQVLEVSQSGFAGSLDEARNLLQSVDPDDVPYLALAISMRADGIWTEDKHFREQTRIPAMNTTEILKKLGEE